MYVFVRVNFIRSTNIVSLQSTFNLHTIMYSERTCPVSSRPICRVRVLAHALLLCNARARVRLRVRTLRVGVDPWTDRAVPASACCLERDGVQ